MTIFLRLRQHFQVRFAEWIMAGIVFSLGWSLLTEPNTFAVNPIFTEIKRWISQPVLGMFCLMFLGLGRAAVLTINGMWRQSPHLRALMAFAGCFFWLDLCFGLSHSGHQPISISVYQWFILIEARTVYVAMKDARVADERAKSDTATAEVVQLRA